MRRLPRLIRPTTMQTVGRIRRLRRIRHVFPQIRITAPARRQSHQTLPPSPLSAIRLSPGTALRSIISDGKLTAGSVINNASAGAVPIPASIIVCTIGISAAVGMTNKHPATAIATTHIRLLSTAPSAWGNNQTRAAPNTSTARM